MQILRAGAANSLEIGTRDSWHTRCNELGQEIANNIMRPVLKALALAVVVAAFSLAITPILSAAEPEAVDLTNVFRSAGANVEQLRVYEIAGVVLLRGRVNEKSQAEEVGRIAQTLGYQRVANLIQVVDHRDKEIARRAEIELTVNRSLDGCRFHVTSNEGNVRVAGQVKHELQKDVAAQVLRNINGIRSVEFALTRF